jgi:hypothetical protein
MPTVSVKAQSSTSISVDWSYDPSEAPPDSVTVNEYNSSGMLIAPQGPLATFGSALFTGLFPNTLYYYQWCGNYPLDGGGELPNCTSWNAYSGRTLSSPHPPPPTPPPPPVTLKITGVQTFPKLLHQNNGINVSWTASGEPVYEVELKIGNSTPLPINISPPAYSGATGDLSVSPPGAVFDIQMRGEYEPNAFTNWSSNFQFTSASNFHSLRKFLAASGVSGSGGIKHLLPTSTNPISLRSVMGV